MDVNDCDCEGCGGSDEKSLKSSRVRFLHLGFIRIDQMLGEAPIVRNNKLKLHCELYHNDLH